MHLRWNLFLLVAGALLPLVVLAAALAYLIIEREREVLIGVALDRNRAFMAAVDTEIRAHVQTLRALAGVASLETDNLGRFHDDARRVLQSQPEWNNVVLILPSGAQVVNARLPYGSELPPITDSESLNRVVAKHVPVIGDVTVAKSTKRAGVAVRVPIVRAGQLVYVLTAVVAPEAFLKLIEAQQLSPGWASGVFDSKNQIIARIPRHEGQSKASADLSAAIAGSREGWYRGRTLEGSDTFTSHNTSEVSGWTVAYAMPADHVNAAAYRAASSLTIAAALCLVAALAFAYWMAHRIAAPMVRLAAYARGIGRQTDAPPLEASNIHEVQLVSQALVEANWAVRERELLLDREQRSLKAAARAKDEFIAMLGHELRNPLSAISSSAQVLRHAEAPPSLAARAREVIDRQVRHMARLLDDLLDVSRVTRGKLTLKREPFDLAELTRGVVSAWRETKAAQSEVKVELTSVWVDGDATRVEQILTNLLENAGKFSPPGSTIEVRVMPQGEAAVLEVCDEGEGIAPELLEHLFQPFVQAPQGVDRARGGMGIGLALVKRLAELHGGTASAHSQGSATGARFTVTLPAIAKPDVSAVADAIVDDKPAPVCSVLVVEDNDDLRDTLEGLLLQFGYRVRAVATGNAAVEEATREPPNVALIDIGLPDISGYEVARRLCSAGLRGRSKLIAVTGYGQENDIRLAKDAGFDLHLTKPVAPEELRKLLAA
jgi:signal transduction histidine kinase